MKKPYKKSFVVFTILAFVMLAIFAATFVLYPMLVLGVDIASFFNVFYLSLPRYIAAFTFNAFVIDGVEPVNVFLFDSVAWIAAVVFAVLFLVFLFVAIFGIKKKPAAKVFGILLAIFGMIVAWLGVSALYHNVIDVYSISDPSGYMPGYHGIVAHFANGEIIPAILLIAQILGVVLYILFAIFAIIRGVKYARAALADDQEVAAEEVAEPAEEEQPQPEPEEAPVQEDLPVFIPEPEDEPIDPQSMSTTALAAIIKDVVREIVRDELERNNLLGKGAGNDSHSENHSVVGATFGGPLIVQYFNGGIQSAVPAPAPAEPAKEEPKPEPVKEEPKPEPQPEPQPEPEPVKEEPAPAPAPVVEEPAPAPVEPKEPKAPIVRIPFEERLLASEKELQELYSEIKNEILSYGVKSRVSSSGDTFRLHRKTYVKMTVAGKSLKLYFALNPDDYRESPIPVQDAGGKSIYAEIPLVFKVKSPLSVRRCKQLIQDVMEKDNLEQGEIGTVNWIKELKAEMKARKAEKK